MEIDEKPTYANLYGENGSPPPITTTLGGTLLALREDALEAAYVGTPAFLNPAGQVQGGMLCAMLDDVTATLVTSTLAEGEHCATLNLNTSFLRPAKPGRLIGRATLVRRGRGVCNVDGELWQDDKLVATATAVCMIVAPGRA
ncbi:MAG TPA: PaaI family thioesterase [Paraburkholderia sp.]|uniref:PaaI family thioesterase n=1 Tax=Paraburkholderia sp. TaxID=1926495 RepID=UPI002C973EB5|nr:PaaI family thioesterase [Paraburkholderia sp.]HTR07827.1 PaaI family thioesterase [Paraburkholderia sp.]